MKELIFAANWKLNKNPSQTRTFFKEFAKSLEQKVPSLNEIKNAKILIFPPATSWEAASLETSSLREKSAWAQQLCWGAQNIY
ncbi:MAG: triose-phosphate isomerase, partial [Bdellovibrionales bacterium]|nr:triose-phosphate isomerase [Bdellovibrionales bacterium]